jgi:hypothetical protein
VEQNIRLEGHIAAEQARQAPYLHLPFHVPPGTRRIHVAYAYSDPVTAPFGLGPGNTLDIGIFDSRGHEFLDPAGFRGWSGGARPEFYIAERDATPGYVPGPLFPGEWHVLLGAARCNPEGIRYDVRITLDSREPQPAEARDPLPVRGGAVVPEPLVAPRTPPPGAGPGRWLRGDLHSHTEHSDGANSVEEVVVKAIEVGLDFLAITDHNTITHHQDMARLSHLPIVLIPGEEVTTYWGHANVWGLREWIEYRCADQEAMDAVRRYVLSRDALISINHPKSVGPPWLFRGWEGYPSMEVWQAPWRFFNFESLERWDNLLQKGERVVAVGGSDTHSVPPAPPKQPHGLGNPTTWAWIEGEPSEEAVLDAVRRGRIFINDAPEGAHLVLTADEAGDGTFGRMMGDTVRVRDGRRTQFRVHVRGGTDRRVWLISDGEIMDSIPLHEDESVIRFSLDAAGRRYLRAELRGYRGSMERGEVVWAMTNPVWFEVEADS